MLPWVTVKIVGRLCYHGNRDRSHWTVVLCYHGIIADVSMISDVHVLLGEIHAILMFCCLSLSLSRGSLLSTMIFVYAVTSPVCGYSGGALYARMGGRISLHPESTYLHVVEHILCMPV